MEKNIIFAGLVAVFVLLVAGSAPAATMNDYCITPPFIQQSITPNLLLMIDNSASMYDLQYQDTSNMYCANAPATACSSGSSCTGTATCLASAASATATIYSIKACTADSQCPLSIAVTTAKTCGADSDCPTFVSEGNSGRNGCNKGACKTDNVTIPKCHAGFCTRCDTSSGVGDCTSSSTIMYTPIACTSDATCSAITAGDTCNNKCNISRQCYDTTYNIASTYYGYFDPATAYSYDFTNYKFTGGVTMPESCTYSAGNSKYLCVNTSGTPEALLNTGYTGFVASGNFLNWLTTTRFDIEKKILTGGKFDTVNNVLIGESRGCAGRKFIKAVPGVNLIFALRGGTAGGISSTQNQATEYGQTYIEIYSGTYNTSSCLSAMNDWMTLTTNPVNPGSFQNDTKACVGAGNGAYNAVNIWNHILHDCYNGILNKAQGYSTNLGPLEGECKSAYTTVAASAISDPNSGISICSSVLSYPDADGNAQTGYLGACYNAGSGTFGSPCDVTQMTNYCTLNINTNPVTDPSSTTLPGASASAPGFILEQGLMNMNLTGTLAVKIGLTTQPTGLVNTYRNTIRIGAMTFQNNGSGSECGSGSPIACAKACSTTMTRLCYLDTDCPSGETCGALPKTDGGKIVSYVGAGFCSETTATACDVNAECPSGEYCEASVGDHTSGLVKNIDDIQATSWTPFAEAFYNAMGYFSRSNSYTVATPTSRSDANFSSLAAPNTATSYSSNKNPSQYTCQSNNVLLITDGMSTGDNNSASESLAALYASQVPYTIGATTYTPASAGYSSANNHGYNATNICPPYSGSRSVNDLAWVAKNRSIKSLSTTVASTASPTAASESITTYVVYSGPSTSGQPGLCDPQTLMSNTATNGGTKLYSATNPAALSSQLDAAFSAVVAQTASGTAASILSNSEGSGASLLQALFYPKKEFDKKYATDATPTSVTWIGELQSFWYYLDPYLQNTSIREDTNGDFKLNLVADKVIQFYFDSIDKKTKVNKYTDANGNGAADSSTPDAGYAGVSPDTVNSLWMAGRKLWNRNVNTNPRTIYTGYNSTAGSAPRKFSNLPADGSLDTLSDLWDTLQIPTDTPSTGTVAANRLALTTKLIDYINGTDQTDDTITPCLTASCKYRSRNVTLQSYCASGTSDFAACTHEWKLGDIISSTPKLLSNIHVNSYNLSPPTGYGDSTYTGFVTSSAYSNRGMAFVGANDGMLHAFKLGTIKELTGLYDKAQLVTGAGSTVAGNLEGELGQEAWAYIPNQALPYLKYLADPAYNHIYYVDKSPLLVDASIGVPAGCIASDYSKCTKLSNGSTWRTILIGGMGIGGASREPGTTSATAVTPPIANVGYSSYFAMDVTYPANPKYMWEFFGNTSQTGIAPRLGFATTGPAIVRIAAKTGASPTGTPDHTKNGKWFAVFASGPLGPIDTSNHAFNGQSDQPLYIFIVDLATGVLVRTINCGTEFNLNLNSAFAGSLASSTFDADRNNQFSNGFFSDDAIYLGYVQKDSSTGTWTKGGVLRITTKESTDPNDATDGWVVSKLIDGVGPVTTSVTKLQDWKNKKLWIYFGTGRFYYKNDDTSSSSVQQSIYGIQEPCYNIANAIGKTCADSFTATIKDQSGTSAATTASLGSTEKGWKIVLDDKDTVNNFATERVITDPLASPGGAVFFTTFKPSSDLCQYGGNSLLWAVRYDTGTAPPASAMGGKALMQVSTGAFQEISLSSSFSNPGTRYDGRRLANPITGVPPTAQGLSLFSNPLPVKKILHFLEK